MSGRLSRRKAYARLLVQYAEAIYGSEPATAQDADGNYIRDEDEVEKRGAIYAAAGWLASGKPLPLRPKRRGGP